MRSSNAGHALFTGIAYPERAKQVAHTVMSASSFCGWGIRTIPSTETRYNPMSYHNGSIWPHDNAVIASGPIRYGYRAEAARIFEGLFAASTYIDLRRLPELFCGLPRQRAQGPTFYPVAALHKHGRPQRRSSCYNPASASISIRMVCGSNSKSHTCRPSLTRSH